MTAGLLEIPIRLKSRDEIDLHLRHWRDESIGHRRTFVVIHGLGEHSGRYQVFARWFVARGTHVYALDLRGHGLSGGQRGHADSIDQLLEDVDLAVSQAREGSGLPLVLVCHSVGGLVGIPYALAHPERLDRAVFSAPALVVKTPVNAWKRVLLKVGPTLLPRVSGPLGLDHRALSRDPTVVSGYGTDPLVHDRATARMARETLGRGEELIASAPRLRVPFLLMHGAEDRIIDPEGSRRFFAGATVEGRAFCLYPGLYHEIFNEPEKERVFQDIEDWLNNEVELSGWNPPP
jgi:alpha-beta hydrolase superfamily lysophospholipase